MKIRAILTALLLILMLSLHSQKNVKSFLVVSYNMENLFEAINSPLTGDDEFNC